jgi:hypothetical protein
MARIYINPAAARVVYGPILAALNPGAAGVGAPVGTSGANIRVPGNTWVNTGFNVRRGETLRFNATGEVTWSGNAADRATPGGSLNPGARPGRPPVANAAGGALVARIDNGQPFLIGNQASVRMPGNGQLFLGINDDVLADNTGDFYVTISR